MKSLLFCAAAIASIAEPQAAAAATGYLDLSYGRTDVEGSSSDTNIVSFGGAVDFELSPDIEAQADAHWSRAENGAAATFDTGAFHLFHRNDSYSYGFVASVEDLSLLGGQIYDLGVEGQIFFARATLDGAVTLATLDTLSEDATRYRVGMTFFPKDNFSFGGGAERLELNGGGEIDIYRADVEFQPNGSQVSYFAGYRAGDDRLFTGNESDAVEIGVRYNFGTASLFERNRTGASKRAGSTLLSGIF